jgi:hypothetical protein
MNTAAKKIKNNPAIIQVTVNDDKITAALSDGREISIPVAWFPRLVSATPAQRAKIEISPAGYGIHWPDVDEDISVTSLLRAA